MRGTSRFTSIVISLTGVAACLALGSGAALAAAPPDLMHYQGVLRDASNNPLSGTFSMQFTFFETPTGGIPQLSDLHPAVQVTNGLFTAALGESPVPSGIYTSLSALFRDKGQIYMEILVGSELLAPRVRIHSAAYALNADRLDGLDSSDVGALAAGNTWTGANVFNDAGNVFAGAGTGLVALNAGNVSSGTLSEERLPLNVARLNAGGAWTGINTFANSSNFFAGNGSSLTGVNATLLDSHDSAEFPLLSTSNAFTTGFQTVFTGSAANTGLIVRGSPGQSANLQEWQNSAGTTLLAISGSGGLTGNGSGLTNLNASGLATGTVPSARVAGTYSSALTLSNAANSFTGSGAGLTNLNLTGTYSGAVTLSNAANSFTGSGAGLTSVNSTSVDGLDSTQFLRRDASDSFASGTLTLAAATTLDVKGGLFANGSIRMDNDGPDGTQSLFFYEASSPTGRSLSWNDAQNRFEANDSLAISGVLRTGTTALATVAYNAIGSGAADATGDVSTASDLYVSDDLEVDGSLILETEIRMNDNGPDGNQIIRFYEDGSPGNEAIFWNDASDQFDISDDLSVTGTFSATGTKNFVQNHPERTDLSVVYTALEGDEAGTYTRGTARLEHGVAHVRLGESFAWVTNPDLGLTAQLTPRGSAADLYVDALTPTELTVRGAPSARQDALFDYVVMGLRIGYERQPIVRKRTVDAAIPPPAHWDRALAATANAPWPTAQDRFREMLTAASLPIPAESQATHRLRLAIGQQDPEAPTPPRRSVPEPLAPADVADGLTPTIAALPGANAGGTEAGPRIPPSTVVMPVAERVELGELLSASGPNPGILTRATMPFDPAVVGVVGAVLTDGTAAVATYGIAPCLVDADYAPIRPGDLLVASPTAGHAMRGGKHVPGTIVGKAIEALESGRGRIQIVVMLQ